MIPVGMDKLLNEHPFFLSFEQEHLKILSGCARNEQFAAGEMIFREGGAADKFYILRHGGVAIELALPGREKLVVQTLHEGDIFGSNWIMPPYRWSFDARATSLTRVISLDAVCLRRKMEENHELGYRLMNKFLEVVASRLEAARLQLIDLYAPPLGGEAGSGHGRGGPESGSQGRGALEREALESGGGQGSTEQ